MLWGLRIFLLVGFVHLFVFVVCLLGAEGVSLFVAFFLFLIIPFGKYLVRHLLACSICPDSVLHDITWIFRTTEFAMATFVIFFAQYNWKVDSTANYLFAGTVYIVFQSCPIKERALSQHQTFRMLKTPEFDSLSKTDLASWACAVSDCL